MRSRGADIPEFFCTDIAFLEMAAPGVLRFGLQVDQHETSPILRVKILMPVLIVPSCIARTTAFLSCQAVKQIGAVGALMQ